MRTRAERPSAAIAAGDLVAVDAGEVAIEDDDVVVVEPETFQRLGAVADDVGGDRLQPERCLYRLGEEALVFHDQNSHGLSVDRVASRSHVSH